MGAVKAGDTLPRGVRAPVPAPPSKVMHTMKRDQSYIILASAEVSHYIDEKIFITQILFYLIWTNLFCLIIVEAVLFPPK